MNKLFTKIAALVLGMTMAVGVGVAVGGNNAKTAYADGPYDDAATMTAGTNGSTCTVNGNSGIKVGTSKAGGNMRITVPAGATALNLYAAAWKGVTGLSLNITPTANVNPTSISLTADDGISNNSPFTLSGQESNFNFEIELSDITEETTLTFASSTGKRFVVWKATYSTGGGSTALTGITLGGAASQNALSIGSSDLTDKTVSVTLTPNNATDQKVNIVHQSGTSGLFTVSSSATCESGSGSFTVTGKGNTSGSETFRISGNTETSVYVDLVVTALDDSATYWTVSFDSDGGATIADMSVEDGETFEFPSPGTKTHYSFDGWSSDGGNTLYNAGATSPAVGADIEYTAYWTEDSKYTVTYVHGDHGTGDDYVVNNVYAGSYTLATFATAGFTASSGYSFKKWSVGGVEYAEGASITISGNTTVTAIYAEAVDYSLFSGVLVEGDYVIYDATSGVALKNELASNTNYIGYTTVSPVSNKFTNPDASLVWHIGASATSGYWTIYNSTVDKYAASTGAKNKGQLLSDGTDAKSLWSCSSTSSSTTYDFVNKQNNTSGVNDTLRYNSGYGFACYSTSTGHVLTLYKAPSNELDSVTTSGQTTSFTAGTKWSYGGTLTAHYTLETDATVTPTSFKFGDSGINPTTAGTAITTDTTLDHDTHNGKYIYVIYAEDNITKYCSYQITVNYAAVTSVVIDTHAAEIGLNETYDYTLVGVTVNTSYADPEYEWIVSANTVDDDYLFDASGLLSGDTEGTITLRCRSTADNSKYDELVVTVTGDPTAEFTPSSVSGYVGKSDDIAFTYGNMSDTSLISITSSNSSIAEVGEFVADAGEGLVTVNFVTAGSTTLSISYDGGSTLDSITVTVSADSVTALTWSAPTIKVYSGATTTASDASSWNVHYTMASGDEGDLSYGEYTLKLGGSSITLPHTWDASEDGKALSIEYGGFSSPTTSTVDVTQTLQTVKAPVEGEPTTSTLTFTEKYATGGATSDGGEVWTVTSDGTESNFDDTKGIHYGTGSASVQYIKLTTDDFATGTINKVVVNASTASGVSATAGVTIGGDQFGGEPQSLSTSAANYTFEGNTAAGEIVVTITKPSSATKAIYCLSVAVTYAESSGTQNIANIAGHEAAQKAVVKFAKAFNEALGATENCTTGLAAAWSTASSKWNTFLSDAAALGEAEEAYAKNLVKYATAQWTEDTDENYEYCLERAMATYEYCVKNHEGCNAFMSSVRSVERTQISPISIFGTTENSNMVAIVVIVSVVSLTAIGGYFFLRKKREQN